MITTRKSSHRGHFDLGWLDTRHTFSFGHYVDRQHMGFRSLRVINEDLIAPGNGFGQHPHDNMEIISYMAAGRLAHKDTLGTVQTISPGEVQFMSAGTGLEHSEFNPSQTEPAHLLQIWIKPAARNAKPAYGQKKFPIHDERDRLHLVVSPDGKDGSLKIGQDARLYAGVLSKGISAHIDLAPDRHAWVQVVKGSVKVAGETLAAGDGASISKESAIDLAAIEDCEVLIFDLD